MVAGVFTTGIMTPGERIKCLLQVSKVPVYYLRLIFTEDTKLEKLYFHLVQ